MSRGKQDVKWQRFDRLKGGGIARMALSLILSDVVGGPLDVMASGPTTPDVQNVIVGSNRQAAQAAVKRAEELGFNALLLSTFNVNDLVFILVA